MKNPAIVAAALLLALSAAGCSGPKTVQFYKTHPAMRALKADKCGNVGRRDSDCVNALQASFEVLGIPAKDGRAIVPGAPAGAPDTGPPVATDPPK